MVDFDPTTAGAVVANAEYLQRAKLYQESTQIPFSVQQMVFALDTAQLSSQPFAINFPFRSVVVRAATDVLTNIDLRLFSMDAMQSSINLKQNDALKFPYVVSKGFLSWSAQSGKSMTLLFLVDGELNLGSFNVNVSGGVTQQDGTVISAIQSVSLSAATATIIAPALASRKTCTIQNNAAGVLYYGGDNTVTDASTAATQGISIPPGGQFVYRNTGALYGYITAGGVVNRVEES